MKILENIENSRIAKNYILKTNPHRKTLRKIKIKQELV
jgi:hypothetical protein